MGEMAAAWRGINESVAASWRGGVKMAVEKIEMA